MMRSFLVTLIFFGKVFQYAKADCLVDPTAADCASYKLDPSIIESDQADLCSQMGNMPGCSIAELCKNDQSMAGKSYCEPFAVLAGTCTQDMSRMRGCKNYNALCRTPNSKVAQCQTSKPLPDVPITKTLTEEIRSICTEMDMDGCELCRGTLASSCNALQVYSNLCIAMPEMHQCKDWKTMCAATPDIPYCQGDEMSSPPQMRMYFHLGLKDYVLFKEWVPRTGWAYALTFIAVVAMGILYEFILTVRGHSEQGWVQESSDKLTTYSVRQFTIDSYRGIFQFFESGLAYLLMLVSMTFNVGLFLAVILGISLGTLIFSRFRVYGTTKRPCGC